MAFGQKARGAATLGEAEQADTGSLDALEDGLVSCGASACCSHINLVDWLLLCAQDNLEQLVQPEPQPEAGVDPVAGYSEDDICEILEIIPEMSVDDLHEALEDIGGDARRHSRAGAPRALDTFYTGRLEALVEG